MDNIFLLGALLYAITFWCVSWRFPQVALAIVFGSATFQNDLSGGVGGLKFSFSEVNLLLTLPLFILLLLQGERRLRTWPTLRPCIYYFLVCLASALLVWRGSAAITSLFQMFLFMFVLIPIFSTLLRRPQDLLLSFYTMMATASIVAIAALVLRAQYVLGLHKNAVGGVLCCAFLVALELYFHFQNKKSSARLVMLGLMLLFSCGLLMSLSRGSWLGTFVGVLLIIGLRRQFLLLTRVVVLLVPLMAVVWLNLPQSSREYATSFDASRGNIQARYNNNDYAMAEWSKNPLLGDGVGLRKQYDATNLVLSTLAETGIIGLITFGAIPFAFFAMLWKTQQRLGREEFSYSLLAIGGALMAARLTHGMVDHYWQRGPTMMAWAAAGMAVGGYLYGPQHSYAQRLVRARVLLSLHITEMNRRRRRGQNLPPLSRLELEQANEALKLILPKTDKK